VIRPPDCTCALEPPSVTAMTAGWLQVLTPRHSLYLGAGRIAGRGQTAVGGLTRLQFSLGGHVGIQAFVQYTLVPSFHIATYQTALAGFSLLLR